MAGTRQNYTWTMSIKSQTQLASEARLRERFARRQGRHSSPYRPLRKPPSVECMDRTDYVPSVKDKAELVRGVGRVLQSAVTTSSDLLIFGKMR